MTDGGGATAVERARDAASTGAWEEAFDLLMGADADGLVGPADLPVLGEVAYAAGHLDVTIEAWERAYAACTQAGRRGRGGRRGRSPGDAPALRHGPHGTRAGVVGTSRATARRQGGDASARLVRGGADLRADADG